MKRRATPYPWDEWFAKKKSFKLIKGEDFLCQTHGMNIMIRQAAYKRGKRVRVIVVGDSLVVQVMGDKT